MLTANIEPTPIRERVNDAKTGLMVRRWYRWLDWLVSWVTAIDAALAPYLATWSTPTFAAGDFTANGAMTWTVALGNMLSYRTILRDGGTTLRLVVAIQNSTIGGVANTDLRIAIPGGYTSAKAQQQPCVTVNGGVRRIGVAITTAAGTFVTIQRDTTPTNWAAGAAEGLYLDMDLEVTP